MSLPVIAAGISVVLAFSVSALEGASVLRFAHVRPQDKQVVCDSVCKNIADKDSYGCYVSCSKSNSKSARWKQMSIGQDDFAHMKMFDLAPTELLVPLFGEQSFPVAVERREEPLFLYLNHASPRAMLEERVRAIPTDGFSDGQYNPILMQTDSPLFVFMRNQRCPLYQRDFLKSACPELSGDPLRNAACSNLWNSSVFVVSQWAAFYVNDDETFHSGEWCYEVGIANAFPLITLTRREATELVYVTALCRGVVQTLKEFNEKYVGKGPAFIVRLSNPKCETEFGRMLYDAVADGLRLGERRRKLSR